MALTVTVWSDQNEITLTSDILTMLPAGPLLMVITGAEGQPVRLDGRVRFFRQTSLGQIASLSLSRSTGFHHLHILPGHHYWFGTEDAKLGLDGIVEMLKYLRQECLTWSGQLLFSDGSFLRDPHVLYGWLDKYADAILQVAERIAVNPRRQSVNDRFITAKGGKHLDLRATTALLRRRQREYLEPLAGGPISVAGVGYAPRKVVVTKSKPSIDTPANRRLVWLLQRTVEALQEVIAAIANPDDRERCRLWLNRARRLLLTSALSQLHGRYRAEAPLAARATEELVDPRYVQAFQLAASIQSLTGWAANRDRRDAYSYVAFADQIYEAFVITVLAEFLALDLQGSALGLVQPAYVGADWEIYYGVSPPPALLRSWRSYTSNPDSYRPDILLHQRISGEILVADAKFRNDGIAAAESGRRDVMTYMAAYDLKTAVIFYPPRPTDALHVHRIAAGGRLLIEATISPVAGLKNFLAAEVPGLINDALSTATWRGA